jgi:ribosome biogenesis GTPase
MKNMNLIDLGWNEDWARHFARFTAEGLSPARVTCQEKNAWTVLTDHGEALTEVCGKLKHEAQSRGDLPAVGDWVAVQSLPGERRAVVRAVMPRKSRFIRQKPGSRTEQQVLAANVDTAFLVSGLDGDFNLRRIERYLTQAWESGARPVIILNKSDLCSDVSLQLARVEACAMGTPIHPVSAVQRAGLDAVRSYLSTGQTVVFLGSSGVGKSSLVNALLGEERLETAPVRKSDSRGRHTTTRRELFLLPCGAMVIDTPGLRMMPLWRDQESAAWAFEDIEAMAGRCRFRDCSHRTEPGCAVQAALLSGDLDVDRMESYRTMERELLHLARRQDQRAQQAERAKWKKIAIRSRKINQGDEQ